MTITDLGVCKIVAQWMRPVVPTKAILCPLRAGLMQGCRKRGGGGEWIPLVENTNQFHFKFLVLENYQLPILFLIDLDPLLKILKHF